MKTKEKPVVHQKKIGKSWGGGTGLSFLRLICEMRETGRGVTVVDVVVVVVVVVVVGGNSNNVSGKYFGRNRFIY